MEKKAAVRTEKKGHIWTIILSRPEVRNAVDGPTAEALSRAFREFDADPDARVAVLFGDNGTFCAGADLRALSEAGEETKGASRSEGSRANRAAPEGDGPMGPTRMLLSKPVIAAISGHCVAGGLELALWCDLRVAEENSILGVFCRRWGVPLIDGGTVRLPRLIGLSRALDVILTGRGIEAPEALMMGLVNRVVPVGKAREEAEALAALIASYPQMCMRADRLAAYHNTSGDLPNYTHTEGSKDGGKIAWDSAHKQEFEYGSAALKAGESLSGATAFAQGKGRHGSFAGFGNTATTPKPATPQQQQQHQKARL